MLRPLTPDLTPDDVAVLAAVRRADEEDGGLVLAELDVDGRARVARLADAGLVETFYDEDLAEAWARITARGVEALREARE